MTLFQCLLVPLDGSATAARALDCAVPLAAALQAKVHVLSASPKCVPAPEALDRLRIPQEHRGRIVLHQEVAYPADAILAAVKDYGVDLLVMSTHGEASEEAGQAAVAGHVAQAALEQCPVPVLLLPPRYRERWPWRSVLVPLSGEPAGDDALTLAAQLAEALALRVDVVHVGDGPAGSEAAHLAQYADAAHHELPARLTELVTRALAPHHCGCLGDVMLAHGEVAATLLRILHERRPDLLVVGWHGRFMHGHAHVLKHLLEEIPTPVLLVKAHRHPPFRLKVGEELERDGDGA